MSESELRVFLAGEGRNELGSRFGDLPFQNDTEPGVIVALLRRVRDNGWRVAGARAWSPGRPARRMPRGRTSYVAPTRRGSAPGRFRHGDTRIVLVAANDAIEASCDVLAFIRDADGDQDRVDAVEEGLRLINEFFPNDLRTVGAVAVPKLEAWILACLGELRTEELSPVRAETLLAEKGLPRKSTAAMVEAIEHFVPDKLASDSPQLRLWLERAAQALGSSPPR